MIDGKNRLTVVSAELEQTIRNALKNVIESNFAGTEFVDLSFYKEYGKLNLEVFIWKKSGITLNDCEEVHKVVSDELDNYEEMFPQEYLLNVSSSGLDRKITTDDDFRRALDTEIECTDDKKNTVHGILKSFDEDMIYLTTVGKKPQEITISRKILTKVQAYIRF